jgi:hypothetical protein
MNVSELRKRILHALDDARRDASVRRQARSEAEEQWETFLSTVAVPLFRQAVDVLRAERQLFSVETPAGSVKLVSDSSPQTFLEVVLDLSGASPEVMGRLSVSQGRGRQSLEERPVAPGRAVAEIGEDEVAAFLVTQVPKLVVRS